MQYGDIYYVFSKCVGFEVAELLNQRSNNRQLAEGCSFLDVKSSGRSGRCPAKRDKVT
jgi:hypothetical protein